MRFKKSCKFKHQSIVYTLYLKIKMKFPLEFVTLGKYDLIRYTPKLMD